jgi:hypothetical protein
MDGDGYVTPEEAALAEWAAHPYAHARVIGVEYTDEDHAVVVTDTTPSHPMWNYCERAGGRWVYHGDSGPAWTALD